MPVAESRPPSSEGAAADRLLRYQLLLDAVSTLNGAKDLFEVQELAVHALSRGLGAERSSLFLYDNKQDHLYSMIGEGLDDIRITLQIGQGLAGEAAQLQEIINVDDAYEDERFDRSFDQRTGFRTRSVLSIPIVWSQDTLIGVLQAINCKRGRFDDDDVQFMSALATQIAAATISARLFKRRERHRFLEQSLETANQVQLSMMPDIKRTVADCPEFNFGAVIQPAQQVGGDFFDALEINDGRIALVVGDVSDKGTPAALFMARAMTLIRAHARFNPVPSRVLDQVNVELSHYNDQRMFATVFLAYLDPGSGLLTYSIAGHSPPIIIDRDGRRAQLPTFANPPLGIAPKLKYENLSVDMHDAMCIYTDGVTDAMNLADEEFGEDRLGELVSEYWEDPQDCCEKILQSIGEFANGADQTDDIAVLMVARSR